MSNFFYDRLTGRTASQPEGQQAIVGRWLIIMPPGVTASLNSVPIVSGDFFVPELSGNWRLLEQKGTVLQGTVARGQQPEEIEADSVRTIGQHLTSLVDASANWFSWLDVVPLVPGMSEVVDLLPLDRMIQEFFGHLEEVCMKPRAHLHVEVERVPVAKARRLPIKAASYLASHTEDWERPLLRGVLPKRILSEVRHDQVDIYENRVAARLVDHISVYLAKRIRVIQKLLKVFQDKEDYSRALGGTYLRQRRILKLWGESIDTNEGRRRAEAALKELEWLKYRVMGLMDSPLYREVPRRTYVAPTLRTTNILANDQYYRRVAELWRKWAGAGHAEAKSPADVHREAQELCRGMDRFALLLVIRALDQLGYELRDEHWEEPVRAPGRWVLEGHGSRVDCVWESDGKIRVETGEKHLAFVAVPMDFGAASNDDQVQIVLDRVVAAAGDDDSRLLVLYAGSSDEPRAATSAEAQRRLHTIGNDPRTGLPSTTGFLPISPWDIGSVERIARALRWFLDSARFDTYPSVIDVGKEARNIWDGVPLNGWLAFSSDGSSLTMIRTPKDFEWDRLGIEQLVDEATETHRQAVAEHERLSDELRSAVHKGKTGTLNPQKKSAHQRCVTTEKQLAAIEKLQTDLLDARSKSEALLVCPACGTSADCVRDFEAREKGCFICSCQECRTRWGTRLCGNRHKYAVMLPGDFVDTSDSSPGWEDRTYGSDLLALPARSPNGEFGFLCPFCGEIT